MSSLQLRQRAPFFIFLFFTAQTENQLSWKAVQKQLNRYAPPQTAGPPEDDRAPLDNKGKKRVQQVIGSFYTTEGQ